MQGRETKRREGKIRLGYRRQGREMMGTENKVDEGRS